MSEVLTLPMAPDMGPPRLVAASTGGRPCEAKSSAGELGEAGIPGVPRWVTLPVIVRGQS